MLGRNTEHQKSLYQDKKNIGTAYTSQCSPLGTLQSTKTTWHSLEQLAGAFRACSLPRHAGKCSHHRSELRQRWRRCGAEGSSTVWHLNTVTLERLFNPYLWQTRPRQAARGHCHTSRHCSRSFPRRILGAALVRGFWELTSSCILHIWKKAADVLLASSPAYGRKESTGPACTFPGQDGSCWKWLHRKS